MYGNFTSTPPSTTIVRPVMYLASGVDKKSAAPAMSAGSLVGIAGLSQSALSQHLKRMREDGIVAARRDGQTIWYRIADPRIETLIAQLHRLYCEVPE